MNWPLLIWEIVSVIIFFDLIFYGFTTLILKWGKPYRELMKKGVLIEDGGAKLIVITWDGTRVRSAILTNKHLIFVQNYLTSVENIDVNNIIQFEIKDRPLRKNWKKLILYINVRSAVKKFKLTTNNSVEWKNALNSLKIKQIIT